MLLARHLKNLLYKKAENIGLPAPNILLKNIIINGVNKGCSGFIMNPSNGSCVYVNTERSSLEVLPNYMYRYAKNEEDYTGYRNRWAENQEELVTGVISLLTMTPEEAKENKEDIYEHRN